MDKQKKFYVTTPIYYINDVPHIGHTCTTVIADVMARYRRLKGDSVFFLTGTDEHGQKVAESAEKDGLEPQVYCDKIAPRFKKAWVDLNIGFDFFIRTTDSRHKKVVCDLLQKVYDNGDVYRGKYEGLYCVGCEKFLTESDLVDGKCPIHPPEKTIEQVEENWFFKLSKYVPQLIKLIENDKTNYIFPEGKRTEVLSKLKGGVNDISISRANVKWGIPVPWDKTQTIYVWFDALINYYSATQFVDKKKDFWPADLHLLGKEILWFHTVIWQAMLLSAGLFLPKKVYIHSFYMIDGQKMSKSLGNMISPGQLTDLFGIDGTKYLIMSSFPGENDSDVGIERFKEKYTADLANNLGNLISRVAKLSEGLSFKTEKVGVFDKKFDEFFEKFDFCGAIKYVFDKWIDTSNAELNKIQPWKLKKDDKKRVEVLEKCVKNLRKTAFHLSVIMPSTGERIEEIFEGEIGALKEPLFPRI
ncbi:methionine--tRNA ligase [Patescibacteria group bacterium]|nr:methionine--tRNA ligase [Patescibacteria group bacterium]